MKLKGKVAAITGAGSGFGRSIAIMFSEEGAKIAILEINEEKGNNVMNEITSKGDVAHFIQVDVTKKDEVKYAFEETLQDFGKLDILVNNAGLSPYIPSWELVMRTNLEGVYNCLICGSKVLQDQGSIVNISSVTAFIKPNNLYKKMMDALLRGDNYLRIAKKFIDNSSTAYEFSKLGVIELTRMFAIKLAPHGIRVNDLAPGPCKTSMNAPIFADPKRTADHLAAIPLNRFGEPEEIAKSTLFLASEDSSYITGQTLTIDGGHMARKMYYPQIMSISK